MHWFCFRVETEVLENVQLTKRETLTQAEMYSLKVNRPELRRSSDVIFYVTKYQSMKIIRNSCITILRERGINQLEQKPSSIEFSYRLMTYCLKKVINHIKCDSNTTLIAKC